MAARGTHKWVYHFTEGSAAARSSHGEPRDLLGGKGAGAAEMTKAGMPVPPGFTITTEACRAYLANKGKFPPGLWEQATAALKTLERKTDKHFGDPNNPLLVSVRSGAKFSMPGMMDTVLNLGLNEETTNGLIALTKDERFALDARRRFIQMFGKTVMGHRWRKVRARPERGQEARRGQDRPRAEARGASQGRDQVPGHI
jgi:pyruvate,orthophosphate dikinase